MTERKGYDYDPQFPDRPLHPDFKMLSQMVIELDGKSDDPGWVIDHAGIDPSSLLYMARQRALHADRLMDKSGSESERLAAAWVDGFILAVSFIREKLYSLEDVVTKDGGRRTGEQQK